MKKFTLYELSVIANAIEHQRQVAVDEYMQRYKSLNLISDKLRQAMDALREEERQEYAERNAFDIPCNDFNTSCAECGACEEEAI